MICKPHTLQITNQGNCILYATTLNIPLGFPTPIEIAHGQWENEFDVNHSILVLLSPSWEDEREKHIDQNTQFSDPEIIPQILIARQSLVCGLYGEKNKGTSR